MTDQQTYAWRLLLIWLSGSLVILFLMIVQQYGGAFGEEAKRAWGWYSTTMVPSTTLMLGIIFGDRQRTKTPTRRPDARTYHLAVVLSLVYLGAALVWTLLWSGSYNRKLVDWLDDGMYFLVPLQGFVSIALGRYAVSGR